MNFELEEIIKMGSYEVAGYLKDLIWEKRIENKVPVLVEGYPIQFMFVDCEKNGMPKIRYIRFMELLSLSPSVVTDGEMDMSADISVLEKEIMLENPIATTKYGYGYNDETFYHMWSGRLMSTKRISLDKLNVSELQRLSQRAIKERNNFILDEAERNALLK